MLELRKLQLERSKVRCGKEEMEYRVLEATENIKRLQGNIDIQDKRILELDEEIEQLKQGSNNG